jgi:serine/threonine-protein kinase RsbW
MPRAPDTSRPAPTDERAAPLRRVILRASYPPDPVNVAAARRALLSACRSAGIASRIWQPAVLAVSEAATNAVLHAYRPPGGAPVRFEVEADLEGDELRVVVRDFGVGIRPRPDSPGAGLGLSLIATLASRVQVRRCEEPPVTELVMAFALAS